MTIPEDIMEIIVNHPEEITEALSQSKEQVFEGPLNKSRVVKWLEEKAANRIDKLLQEAYWHLSKVEGAIRFFIALEGKRNKKLRNNKEVIKEVYEPWGKEIRSARRLLISAAIQNGADILKTKAE